MSAIFSGGYAVAILTWVAVLVPQAMVVLCHFPATLTLERAFPTSHGVELSQLRARDSVRHGRFLQDSSSSDGVVDFPLQGTYNPELVGLYYTKVQLGSPPKEFYVQVDTGSDVLWVNCNPCDGCPKSTVLDIKLEAFNPMSSSTASLMSCSDRRCYTGADSYEFLCSGEDNQCRYSIQYGDGSGTSGYYVEDVMHFYTAVGNSETSNATAPVVFGCSTSQTGDFLTKTDRAVAGIFGFGQRGFSIISQLSSQGIAPDSFSHCLKGGDGGGGLLVFGQIVEPNLVYTPLIPLQPHYNVDLQSIAVNGQKLPIDPLLFSTSANQGTIIDSGTTLAYFAEEVYDPFDDAITEAVSQFVNPVFNNETQSRCYITSSSVSKIFPIVSLNFEGSATMTLKPEDYLIKQQESVVGDTTWCLGFLKSQGGERTTIFGDVVLKDKIVVYDIGGQRIGWANYDCSTSVNVSTISSNGKSKIINEGQIGGSSSLQNDVFKMIPISILASILHSSSFL